MHIVIHILNMFFYLSINVVCYFTDHYDKIKEQFPFENYFPLSTIIPEPHALREKRGDVCFSKSINLVFANNSYQVCLQSYELFNSSLIKSDTNFIVYNNESETLYNLDQLDLKFVKGCVCDKPYLSTFSGYIDDNKLYGRMELHSKVFYIEPIHKFHFLDISNVTNNAIIYEVPVHKSLGATVERDKFQDIFKNSRKKRNAKPIGRLCSLFVLIDNSFLKIIANNSIKHAITIVLHSLDLANTLFRSTDFNEDGVPDNVGFSIKFVMVLDSEDTGMNKLPLYSEKAISGLVYLFFFSQYELLGEVCLGTAFSAQSFLNRVLGLSYTGDKDDMYYTASTNNTGGICERPSRKVHEGNFNNFVITYRLQNGETVPQVTSDLSLAHELGHSFGSDHDTAKSCLGYLMAPHTFNNTYGHNFLFSSCSKKKISEIIDYKGTCLEPSTDPFCGNGLLEENEECDCGLGYTCINIDKCCTPRNGNGIPCTVNRDAGYQCHPSQGFCCRSDCQYQDISHIGLSCEGFETRKCPCKNLNATCPCGILGNCIGSKCHSIECTRIGLTECKCNLLRLEEQNTCVTCCHGANGKCLPSSVLTKKFATLNEVNLEVLKSHSVNDTKINNPTERFKEFCFGTKCVILPFRTFRRGDFCLYKGDLGTCHHNYTCRLGVSRWLKILGSRKSLTVSDGGIVYENRILFLLWLSSILFYF